MFTSSRLLFLALIALSPTFLSSCGTSKKAQLEAVAKDWCLTIRASQVIPVYPLTEDVQPGDIFLVQVPIDRQQQVYEQRGFLPLDNHLARLNPHSYTNFYHNSFLPEGGSVTLPRDWIRPASTNIHSWELAPHAAFPSYSFSVRRGEGLNLAVPVDGVPVGLSMLNSDAADGSVTIKQGRTMGIDTVSLWAQVQTWAKENAKFLSTFAPSGRDTNYIRVITRVYACGQMDVSLRDASSQSGGLDVGAAKPVNLLFPTVPKDQTNTAAAVAENYTNGWNALQTILAKATEDIQSNNFLPGGSLRLTGASSRTIALQEEFDPPIVLGYLGFDCAISQNGEIEPPIPTHAHLDPKSEVHHAKVQQFNDDLHKQIDAYNSIAVRYKTANPTEQQQIREWAQELKLSAEGDSNHWVEGLGAIVDGNDPVKTGQLGELKTKVDTLKN